MPVRAPVGAAAALPAFLPVQQAVVIEQAQNDAAAGDAHHFVQCLLPAINKTQGRDGDDMVEAAVGERQLAGIAFHP